jgi:hypothetical protein
MGEFICQRCGLKTPSYKNDDGVNMLVCKPCCEEKRKSSFDADSKMANATDNIGYTCNATIKNSSVVVDVDPDHGDNQLSPYMIPCDVCGKPTRHDLLEQQVSNGPKKCLACIADQHLRQASTPENNRTFVGSCDKCKKSFQCDLYRKVAGSPLLCVECVEKDKELYFSRDFVCDDCGGKFSPSEHHLYFVGRSTAFDVCLKCYEIRRLRMKADKDVLADLGEFFTIESGE